MMDDILPIPRLGKPLKAPNESHTVDMLPLASNIWLMSYKFDGNRMLCIRGRFYTSSMKEPRNKHLYTYFAELCDFSRDNDYVLDFEIYNHEGSHHAQLAGIINSYNAEIPTSTRAYVFDLIPLSDYVEQATHLPYYARMSMYTGAVDRLGNTLSVKQTRVTSTAQVLTMFKESLAKGYEGLMIRAALIEWENGKPYGGWYKHGRATVKQKIIYKMKEFQTLDGWIIDVIPRMRLRPGVARTYDAYGNLEPVYAKSAYEPTPCVGAFVVKYYDPQTNKEEITEVGFGKGFPIAKREQLWQLHKDGYFNSARRHIEFSHMPHGAKDTGRVRHGRIVRFRLDLDD